MPWPVISISRGAQISNNIYDLVLYSEYILLYFLAESLTEMIASIKKFMILFVLHVPWVFYLAFVDVRSADTHLQPNLYHTLGGKTFHLFWLKVPVPQGRPAPLCSETAWPISQKNEWVDDFFFAFLWFFC